MSFKEELQKLSVQIIERKKHIINEEMTKQALIIPFLQVLGYDVFNPLEVKPEYVSDFGKKKGAKVDYAVFKDNTPIIFIEAKSVAENLDSHSSQLAMYFNATPAVKLAIITNGVVYKFFTDIDINNIMDENPFAAINLTDLSDSDIEVLTRFKKEAFDTESLIRYAEDLIYTSNLNIKLRNLLKNPPDDFVKYLIKEFSDTKITSNVIERFRPIVKKSISNAILDIVSQGILQQDKLTTEEEKTAPILISPQVGEMDENDEPAVKKQIKTTEDELKGFEIVKSILLNSSRDVSGLQYNDTLAYFGMHIRNTFYWFIRTRVEGENKYLIIRLPLETARPLAGDYKLESAPKGHGDSTRIYIENLDDLQKLDKLIIKAFDEVAKL